MYCWHGDPPMHAFDRQCACEVEMPNGMPAFLVKRLSIPQKKTCIEGEPGDLSVLRGTRFAFMLFSSILVHVLAISFCSSLCFLFLLVFDIRCLDTIAKWFVSVGFWYRQILRELRLNHLVDAGDGTPCTARARVNLWSIGQLNEGCSVVYPQNTRCLRCFIDTLFEVLKMWQKSSSL